MAYISRGWIRGSSPAGHPTTSFTPLLHFASLPDIHPTQLKWTPSSPFSPPLRPPPPSSRISPSSLRPLGAPEAANALSHERVPDHYHIWYASHHPSSFFPGPYHPLLESHTTRPVVNHHSSTTLLFCRSSCTTPLDRIGIRLHRTFFIALSLFAFHFWVPLRFR